MDNQSPMRRDIEPANWAGILLLIGLFVAMLQWTHIGYRIHLYRSHGSKPYVNHVADGTFRSAYAVSILAIGADLVALYLLTKRPPWTWLVAAFPLVCNAAALATLVTMRSTGVLVEYGEFVKHLGP